MRSDEIVTACRYSAYIGDASEWPEYPDARVLLELNDKLFSVFEDIVVKARSGYWLKEVVSNTVIGRGRYRIPPRAVTGGLEKVEIANAVGGVFYRLEEISPVDVENWEGSIATGNPGNPEVFVVMGDQLELFPTPNLVLPMRLSYYVRPSRLVAQQSSTLGGGTVRGQVTVVNTTTRAVTVNAVPFNQELAAPAAITSGSVPIDIVHPDGWHELAIVGATQTLAGSVFTLTDTQDMSDIQLGDFVRAAEQTDWPCLPDDFHRCLADVAAIKIMLALNWADKANQLAENVGNDLVRFRSLLLPRVKSEPKTTPVHLASRGGYW